MNAIGQIKNCDKCNRKILIERVMLGVNHTLNIIVNCWECLSKVQQIKSIKFYKIEE